MTDGGDGGDHPAPRCTGCGAAVPAGCPGDCAPPLDPPRFCPTCGRRLAVQVFPTSVEARCREHGDVPARPGPGQPRASRGSVG